MLYTYFKGGPKKEGIKQKPSFVHQGVYYFTTFFEATNATISSSDFPNEVIGKRTFRWENAEDIPEKEKQNPVYLSLIKLLRTSEEFDNTLDNLTQYYDNMGCIKIRSVEEIKSNGEKVNILNENLREATNVDIYYHYINTPLKTDANTIKKGIEKGHYIDNVCWRNALMDFYSETLMRDKA